MVNNQYNLRYLPIFFDDVNNITNYIKNTLLNPQAANDLLDSIENAILQRLPICESFEPYNSKKIRQYPYYRIYVKNYIVYYVVIADGGNIKTMEIRRLLHNRQDRDDII